MPRKVLLIVLGTLIFLFIGAAGMRLLMSMRKPPQRQVSEVPGKLVRVVTVTPQDVPLTVRGFGVVRAKTEWSAVPEVSGLVVQLSPQVRTGLHVKKGELLFEIDPRPYRLAVQRIRAQITQLRKEIVFLKQQRENHQATLRIAKRNLTIADEELRRDEALVRKGTISARELDRRRQWRNEFANAVQAVTNSLALVGPQVEKTEAAIVVAQAQLAEAELQLHKTRLVAPFDGQVVSTTLALGEFVQAGREVVTLYDTAAVEIPIAVPLDDLRWLPTLSPETLRRAYRDPNSSASLLPPATVHWHGGDEDYTWQGRVVRWEAGLDEKTRTLTLVVEVRNPWGSFVAGQHPPLQPGMFCEVQIRGTTVPDAVVIPRIALRDNQTVFLAHDGVLEIRPVRVLRLLREQAIITAGLRRGDKVVISPLSTPVAGMKLRLLEAEPPLATPAATVGQSDNATVLARRPGNQRGGR
jgi:RND family efflux transporter MFP subunit